MKRLVAYIMLILILAACGGGGTSLPPPPSLVVITTITLPTAVEGKPYNVQLQATGGSGSYTWTETGELPVGLVMSTSGLLSGTPTTSGEFSIEVTCTEK